MWWEISNFADDIEKIEGLLFDVAAHDDELKAFGLRYVIGRIDFEGSRDAFDNFSAKLANSVRVASITNRTIHDRLTGLLEETNLEDLLSQLSVRIKIAERERPSPIAQGVATYAYIFRRFLIKSASTALFSDNTIPLESVLASLSRLRTIVKQLEQDQYRKTSNDDEIFKPSNVNIDLIVTQIESAIEHVTNSEQINQSEKARLIAYLDEAKAELAEDSTAWKKVVGALIICATLLSGVAAAPQAIENLDVAIKHILGTSVEKSMPNLLPETQKEPEKSQESEQDDSSGEPEVIFT
jgi:hypothetical protein